MLAHLLAQQTRQNPDQRRVWKVRLIRGLYERGLRADDVRRLFRLIDWIMDLPAGLDQQFWHEIRQFEEEKRMPYVSSVERLGFERGRQEGQELGRLEGRQQGRQEGRQEALLQGLETALALKFGEPGFQLLPELRALHDPDQLATILEKIRTSATVEELRQLWQ